MAKSDLITRVVSLPVREVVDVGGLSVLDTFRPLWVLSTNLANWAQRELVLRDTRRTSGMDRLPAYDRAAVFGTHPRRFNRKATGTPGTDGYRPATVVGDPQEGSLYHLFSTAYPDRHLFDGCTVSARDILKAVEHDWVRHKSFGRYAVLWQCRSSACTFKYPYPWPVPADKGKTLRLSRLEPDRPFVSIPMPDQEDDRLLVRLADGREYRRQLRSFDYLMANPDRLAQAKLCGVRSNGRLVGAILRLVGRFDPGSAPGSGVAVCRTGPDALVTVTVADDGGRQFVYHGDELPGVVIQHDLWRKRFATDHKHEKRWPAQVRRRRVNGPRVRAKYERCANRLRTARQTVAFQVVAWLLRNGVSSLRYDDADKSFLPRFDWSGLREVLRFKCREAGIRFQTVAEVEDDPE